MAHHKTYDSTVVKEVRNQALGDILEVLHETPRAKKFGAYKKEMLLKLATTVLPRVQEHTGSDGEPIQIRMISFDDTYGSNNSSQLPTE